MSNIDPSQTMINGPVNVIRLEGKINNIKKVVYLFFDYHSREYQCSNPFSQEIREYFAHNFLKLNKHYYDLFIEYDQTSASSPKEFEKLEKVDDYMGGVIDFILKIPKKNKSLIRFRYIDIRDVLDDKEIDPASPICDNITKEQSISVNLLDQLSDILQKSKGYLQYTLELLQNPQGQVIKKMKQQYHHNQIKQIINSLLNEIETKLKKCIEENQEIEELINQDKTELTNNQNKLVLCDSETGYYIYYEANSSRRRIMITELVNQIISYQMHNTLIYANFTDLYLLRRLLDKDTITHAIIYMGTWHCCYYLHVLCHYFHFRVTHFSYSKISNLNQLNKELQNLSPGEISGIMMPEHFTQCSDMTHFPKNFS